MAKICPDRTCPSGRRGIRAEYLDERETCSDCGATLVPSPGVGADPVQAAGAGGQAPWLALALTLGVPLALMLVQVYLTQPGVDAELLMKLARERRKMDISSVFSLGLIPFITGSVIVELAALVVPRWRALRHDWPDGRRRLLRASLVVTACAALLQAFFLSSWMLSNNVQYAHLGEIVTMAPAPFRALTMLSLTAGVFVFIGAAMLVDRQGLLPGVSAVLLVSYLVSAGNKVLDLQPLVERGEVTPFHLTVLAGFVGAVMVSTYLLLRQRGQAEPGGWRPRQPVSGTVPVEVASQTAQLLVLLLSLGLLPLETLASPSASTNLFYAKAGLSVVLAIALPLLFYRPSDVVGYWRSRQGVPPGSIDPLLDEAAVKGAVRRALPVSVGWFIGLWVVSGLLAFKTGQVLDAFILAGATAILLDLRASWASWRLHGPLVAVRHEHRLHVVDGWLVLLRQAGIPALAQGVHHRTLLQVFGPFVPVALLVPASAADEARRLLDGLDGAATSHAPAAPVMPDRPLA